eukprot:symbB.v1.2.018427.t1/scaffold1470.1/size116919/10
MKSELLSVVTMPNLPLASPTLGCRGKPLEDLLPDLAISLRALYPMSSWKEQGHKKPPRISMAMLDKLERTPRPSPQHFKSLVEKAKDGADPKESNQEVMPKTFDEKKAVEKQTLVPKKKSQPKILQDEEKAVPQKRKGAHLDSVTSPCPISDSLKCIQPQPIQPSSKMQPEKMKPQKAERQKDLQKKFPEVSNSEPSKTKTQQACKKQKLDKPGQQSIGGSKKDTLKNSQEKENAPIQKQKVADLKEVQLRSQLERTPRPSPQHFKSLIEKAKDGADPKESNQEVMPKTFDEKKAVEKQTLVPKKKSQPKILQDEEKAVPQKRKGAHLDSVTSPCPISDSLKCVQPQPIQPSSKMQPEKMKPQKAERQKDLQKKFPEVSNSEPSKTKTQQACKKQKLDKPGQQSIGGSKKDTLKNSQEKENAPIQKQKVAELPSAPLRSFSSEASNSMGSELTIFLQNLAMRKSLRA